jgi:hypothetical protein
VIIKELPDLFSDFKGKYLKLLYRESGNFETDFGRGLNFHIACDGHPNTLTIVSHSNGSIFGGFTPLPWASSGCWIKDPSCQTFLFTLRNPSNTPPMRFFVQPNASEAIYCDESTMCRFDYGSDHWGSFDGSVLGDVSLAGSMFLTGDSKCSWTKLEVFEVMDDPKKTLTLNK